MLPLNQVALLARVVLCFISVYSFISDSVFICIKILERIPNLNSQFVYIFSGSSYAYNFLWSGETSYSELSTIWIKISYLLSYDIGYLVLLNH